ncbi:hypothetical protein [Pectobacterium aroidearum]|uniref:hypothetical protein n=1 Tax=Pectobacterium aroidearum TaxID=1201031 RepID=UPI0015DEBD2A|nr:hypothetical protein [Pectobacterium aroidearum]MBA0204416.1 hypothetical protein [Pectobacterium aroidearum]
MEASLHLRQYPMLDGILTNECDRLHLDELGDSFQRLFDQENVPGVQETLDW